MSVSRSSYYRKIKPMKEEEIKLEELIVSTFKKHKKAYGRIRIKKELERQNVSVSEWKIAKIMKKHNLVAKGGRKRSKKSCEKHKALAKQKVMKQNLIKDKFAVTNPNKLWSTDITEFRIARGKKLYVCAILDVATRRVVGWEIAVHMREIIVHRAFEMAYGRNPNMPNERYYHSDGGSQFTSIETTILVEKPGFIKSVSRPGIPQDNQPSDALLENNETRNDINTTYEFR